MIRRLLPFTLVLPLVACDLFDQEIEIPIDLTSPPQDFNVDEAVAEAEGKACETADSESCVALTAICKTGGGDCTQNPSMPAEFPAEITILPGDPPTRANDLMQDLGVSEATELKVAMPVDVGGALEESGVESPDVVDDVSIQNVQLEWPANTLTFDVPPVDLFITTEALGDEALDAAELIASGKLTKIGTVGIDVDDDGTIDVGQVAGSKDPVPVAFVEGGNALFNKAVKGASFTIATAIPEGHALALKEKDGDPNTLLKPAGAGKVQLRATLVYKVSASDIIAQAQ